VIFAFLSKKWTDVRVASKSRVLTATFNTEARELTQ
jgi:hypothetical protein